ncbi:GDSL-type esterase/lipase family protein [Pseudonocardia sp.]|jgi:lysophospholipase L1-like esterase|uniref:GDSL-type esterase/lipase family protein n=1 Tax=Pseudonocardia sp. TaxID=60912 RepID=UPI003D0D7BD0
MRSGLRLCLVLLLTVGAAATLGAAPAAASAGEAVVALGDSTASGEGAGDYEPGTRGEGGNWCHRSPAAYVHRSGLAPVTVNLACSGADTAAVRLGSGPGSQAAQLASVARAHRVTTVTVQIGSNDDVALTTVLTACIRAFLDPRRGPCRDAAAAAWPARLAATVPKVEAAVADIRSAMRDAGYTDDGYVLVLLSYAAPVTERMGRFHSTRGCPYHRVDAGWARTVALPQLAGALAGVASRAGARFLDLSRATEGREACSRDDPAAEWQRRLSVDPEALRHGGLGTPLVQESFHPNAAGHTAIGGCLGSFVRGGAPAAACLPTPDGTLQAVPVLSPGRPGPAAAS